MRLSVMLTLHSISLWSMDTEISLEGDKNFTPVTFVYNQNHIPYIHVRCTFNLYWCLPQLLLSFHWLTFFSSTSISICTIVKTFYNILYTFNLHFFIFCFFLCIKFSFWIPVWIYFAFHVYIFNIHYLHVPVISVEWAHKHDPVVTTFTPSLSILTNVTTRALSSPPLAIR